MNFTEQFMTSFAIGSSTPTISFQIEPAPRNLPSYRTSMGEISAALFIYRDSVKAIDQFTAARTGPSSSLTMKARVFEKE